MADRYAKKRKRRTTTTGTQPPERGHGNQPKSRPVKVAGANGNGNGTTNPSFLGRVGNRSSLLTQTDRRLIRELTQALRENSALLRGSKEDEVPSQAKQSTVKTEVNHRNATEDTESTAPSA